MIRPPAENISNVAKKAKAAMVAPQVNPVSSRTPDNYQDKIRQMAAKRLAR